MGMGYTQLRISPTPLFLGISTPFDGADFVLLGVPFDATSTYRPGSRFGPLAIRKASENLEVYSFRTGLDLEEEVRLFDMGDLNVLASVEGTLDRLETVVREVLDAGKFPVILGGEHTITYGAVKALGDGVAVLSFDAHMDLRDEYLGSRLSHATFMRRLAELIGPEKVMEVGVRAVSREELGFAEDSGLQYISEREIVSGEGIVDVIDAFLSDQKRVYLTIDMDVIDPSYAPAVGNPFPGGMSPTALLDILQSVWPNVVGFDLVEVSPLYDGGQTAIQAAHIVHEALAIAEQHQRMRRE